jgi:site-specific DNA recombinase
MLLSNTDMIQPGAKAFFYGRYSSHAQNDASIEQQLRECQEYAKANGIKIIGEYADRGISGRKDNRPAFQKMIRDVAKPGVDVQYIITWKVDRFARNREDAAIYKGRLRKYGVRILYAKEAIPAGPEGILLESMLEGTAEYYSANLSQNVKRGMRDNAMQCKVNSGALPLGYCKGPDGRFEIVYEDAEIVREVFELYASGVKIIDICELLNSRGLRTSQGRLFNKNGIHNLIRNERYTGVYIWGGVRVEGGIPPIISRQLYEEAQRIMDKNKHAPAANVDYILTGKLFCGKCKSPMVGESGTSRTKDVYYYYTCSKRKREHTCDKKSVRKDFLEDSVVLNTVRYILTDEHIDIMADAVMAYQERERDSSAMQSLLKRKKEIEKSINNIISAIEQGIITPTTKIRLEQLEADKLEIDRSITQEQINQIPLVSKEEMMRWIKSFRDGDVRDPEYRANLISVFIQAIFLYDDKLIITYNYNGKGNQGTFNLSGLDDPNGSDLVQLGQPNSADTNTYFCLSSGDIVAVFGLPELSGE